jgi:hypothetical protein
VKAKQLVKALLEEVPPKDPSSSAWPRPKPAWKPDFVASNEKNLLYQFMNKHDIGDEIFDEVEFIHNYNLLPDEDGARKFLDHLVQSIGDEEGQALHNLMQRPSTLRRLLIDTAKFIHDQLGALGDT